MSVAEAAASFTDSELRRAAFWLGSIGDDWKGEIPSRLHEKGVFGLGSSPPFSPEFIGYIGKLMCKVPGCETCRRGERDPEVGSEARLRATRAFRKLRKVAPREFDTLYMYCLQGRNLHEIAYQHTRRARERGHDETYTAEGAFVLLMSGIDKVTKWW